jgi:hypothetical protein
VCVCASDIYGNKSKIISSFSLLNFSISKITIVSWLSSNSRFGNSLVICREKLDLVLVKRRLVIGKVTFNTNCVLEKLNGVFTELYLC